jgi:hypothetical protein
MTILTVWLNGPSMGQAALDELRALLGLGKRGRLEDGEDIGFGSRILREDNGATVGIGLNRVYDGDYSGGWDDDWCLRLWVVGDATVDEETVGQVRADFEAAARAAGFTPGDKRRRRRY